MITKPFTIAEGLAYTTVLFTVAEMFAVAYSSTKNRTDCRANSPVNSQLASLSSQ